jgi:hypothetical protein
METLEKITIRCFLLGIAFVLIWFVVRAIETRVCGDPLLWPDVYQDLHLSVFPASLYRL